MQENLWEKTVSQSLKFEGRIVKVRVDEALLPNEKVVLREVVEHPGGVTVAALTKDKELLFVRQFRYPYGEVLLELPAGKLEPGEDPFEAVQRELQEETGAIGTEYQDLGKMYPSPGFCDEILYLYACKVDRMEQANPDDDEFLQVEKIPLDRAVEMVLKNEITDAKTQLGVLKAAMLEQSQAQKPAIDPDTKICHCRKLTAGDIANAIREGAETFQQLQEATGAATVCGRCKQKAQECFESLRGQE